MIIETRYSLGDHKERILDQNTKQKWYIDGIRFDEDGITYNGYVESSNFVKIKKAKGTSVPISILEANNKKFEAEEVNKWVNSFAGRWALPEKEFEVLNKDLCQNSVTP